MHINDMFTLSGKVALVTGGAGLYGQQIVEACAEAGAVTWIASRHIDALEELAEHHRDLGHDVRAAMLDQSDEGSVLALRDRIAGESGRLDILVNNAVARPMKGYGDDAAHFDESMRVNATGLFMVTRAMGDFMAEADGGSIVNIGSIMGMIGPEPDNYTGTDMNAWYPDYFFHKGGMINFTRFVASYYGARNVRCNCVSLGGLYQPDMPEAFVAQYSERTCLGRLANDTDAMGPVLFLASGASAYVTGANLLVDGGYTAK